MAGELKDFLKSWKISVKFILGQHDDWRASGLSLIEGLVGNSKAENTRDNGFFTNPGRPMAILLPSSTHDSSLESFFRDVRLFFVAFHGPSKAIYYAASAKLQLMRQERIFFPYERKEARKNVVSP